MTLNASNLDEAVLTIRPLKWSEGPNFWIADVEGWGISAPTVRELLKLLRAWFDEDEPA